MMDIRPTSDAAVDYVWFGRTCLEQARRSGFGGAKAIRDGRWLVICKYTLHHATLITLSQGDFTMHPRSGLMRSYPVTDDITIPGINGGGYIQAGNAFAEMSSRLPYPLVDDDHGTFVVSIDGDDLEVEWAEAGDENYGNIWWTGTGGEPITLSWKGPPSVQFGLPSSASISGLTQAASSGVNTPFGCYIYQDGARLCHGPQQFPDNELATLVLGACYATDGSGTAWLVAICVTNRDSRYVLQVWRSKDIGKVWELIAELLSSTPTTPAFISGSGKAFVYGGIRYEIDDTVSSVTRGSSVPDNTSGTRTIQGDGGYGSSYAFEGGIEHCWPGMSPSGEVTYSTYTEEAAFTGTGSGNAQNPTTEVPVYRGNPATGVTLSVGYSSGTFEFKAEAQGSYCSLNWSGVDRSNGVTAWKTPSSGCNSSFTVTVTLLPQGVSATYTRTAELNSMVLSGPAAASVGAQYTAQGAVGTVSWSIGSGSISSYGTITDTSGCGTTTITATDECGRSASLSVRLPTGVWVYDYTINYPGYAAYAGSETVEYAADGSFMEYTIGTTFSCGSFTYVMRYNAGVGCYQWSYCSAYVCTDDFPVSALSTRTYTRPESTVSYNSCADGHPLITVTIPETVCPYKVSRSVHYKWVCP